jgi:ubiquinone/menaquinone biosynthesis C-methylase UbiE
MRKIKTKKLIQTWNKESESYAFDNRTQPDYLSNYYHLEKCFGNLNRKKILEVGSGSGQTSAYLATKGALIHLVDISNKSLEFSKKYFDFMKLQVKLYNQNAFNMKFTENSFDYVWNGGVIEHFDDRKKILMIKKMWRLVKPGGKLLITAPNAFDFPFIIAKKILQLRNKWSFGYEDSISIKKMKRLANLAGISNVEVYAYNPIVGFWFFPYGREITEVLKLNTLNFHKKKSLFGHVLIMCAKK